ncbi:MAG TPA: DUF2802 domain-containing protein [Methylococcaceae bacterium]|jgi:hypothetical protein|nr:DUF2802 domain-containing protein [Methylococcaceae bacterium]HIN68990.1 DUF2802 domain-containing protein [Methylococcales bacterium]HIA44663.1 DUF2802 domain-containing protein [Methylococcaceae bacterium]HIB62117.1 DUF2802 domain-containing protein [Methylococcaceae bacterium]HIO12933.1 DUF2802 domain-containing protein [Methylococcales bacterium]
MKVKVDTKNDPQQQGNGFFFLAFTILVTSLLILVFLMTGDKNLSRIVAATAVVIILSFYVIFSLYNKPGQSLDPQLQQLSTIISNRIEQSLSQQLTSQIGELQKSIPQQLKLLAQVDASPKQSLQITPNEQNHLMYSHAIRLAKEQVSLDKIVEICGINRSEAELILQMHGGGPKINA